MAYLAPSNLTATGINSSRIDLAWQNNGSPPYTTIFIERKPVGGTFAVLEGIAGSNTSYQNTTGLQDGTEYVYRIRAYWATEDEYSDYSNEANGITLLGTPSGMDGDALSETSIKITWNDNSQNETGFKIYMDGVYLISVGQNVEEYTKTGLNSGQWYKFKCKAYNAITESVFSNEVSVKTGVRPAAPSLLTAAAVGTTKINLEWQDNSDNETGFKIEEKVGAGSFAQIDTVGAGITHYQRTGLTSNTLYTYRVRAYNGSGNSAYSNEANATTWAAIATPSNLVTTPFSDTKIEITFQDNSELEDFHCVERKLGAGSFAEIIQLAPNRTFYRDSGLVKGSTYTYRVRAKQGASTYSSYSNEATATTISEPAAPTTLAVSEHTDTTMRLTWVKTNGETGYKIERSSDGSSYAEIAVIGAGLETFLDQDLAANTHYWYKIRAYNAAGNSAYTSTVNDWTDATYTETAFERLLRNPNPELILLCEVAPKMRLSGFTLTSGKTYTWELAVEERGIDITAVLENGEAMTERATVALVEASASSFFFDYWIRKLYIHTAAGGDPAESHILAQFWLYFTDSQTAANPINFNDNNYLGLLRRESIPDINSEISRYFEGASPESSGRVSFINAKIGGEYYFDKLHARYIWENAPVVLKAGGPGFAYADFKTFYTGVVKDRSIDDSTFSLDLRNLRDGLARELPTRTFSTEEFSAIDENVKDNKIPFVYGPKTNFVPICIDTIDKKFKLHDGRIKSVSSVKKNGEITLTENTDYFVDLQRGVITLARGLAWASGDYLLVDFIGAVNSADESIENGAEIFKHIHNEFLGLADSELDLDSIYYTKYQRTATLCVPLYRGEMSSEVIRRIEQSIRASSFQDAEGRMGLKPLATTAASNARYILNHHIVSHNQEKKYTDSFYEITAYYLEDSRDDSFLWAKRYINTANWETRTNAPLEIKTYLTTESDVQTLLDFVIAGIGKETIISEVKLLLLATMPGEIIKYSRDRYYSISGSASEVDLRIISITKSIAGARTGFTGEEI